MRRHGLFHIEWGLFIPVVVLVLFSLTTLFSINIELFRNQLFYTIVSLVVFFLVSHVHYKILPLYSLPIYIASLIVLTIVLLIGFESRGAVRWIEVFGFSLQFSELFKPLLLISLATLLANGKNTSFKTLFFTIMFLSLVSFLIYLQPDLGSALVYVGVTVATLIVYGFPLWWFGVMGVCSIISLPILWQFMHEYQRHRILTFFNPESDPLGTSYNAIQAVIAVGSGGFLGKGLGQGTQSGLRFLPERHTDFIFATLSEEFGFFGSMIIIVAFSFLFYKLFMLFLETDDPFRKMYITGAFFLFFIQFFANIGMNIGLVPIVGITLPFVSYGGSSLLASFLTLGIIASFSRENRSKDVLEIR